LLTWNTARKSNKSSEVPTNRRTSPSPASQDSEMFLMKNYQWSETKKTQYAGSCPYGVEQAPTESTVGSQKQKPKFRSLADIMGKSS
jgi:hypothetical protein